MKNESPYFRVPILTYLTYEECRPDPVQSSLFLMLRNNLLKNITVKLAEMINAKHAATIIPSQKHAVKANL